MYILGINETHNSSAALLKDGQIIACCQEERFTRIKGQGGFPENAITFCLDYAHISIDDVDLLVFGGSNPIRSAVWKIDSFATNLIFNIFQVAPAIFNIYNFFLDFSYLLLAPIARQYNKLRLSKKLSIPLNKIIICDHHTAHAFAAYCTQIDIKNEILVITNDGGGGNYSSKVFIVNKNNWRQIASTPEKSSLAALYHNITRLLGFNPHEDEYKVMGLSAFAHKKDIENIIPVFKNLIWCKGFSFYSKIPVAFFYLYFKKELGNIRFDAIAGAVQKITEILLTQQVKNVIEETGIGNVVLGGGLAMNIKANMKVSQMKEVKNIWICPSSGDESNSIGHAFFGYKKYCDTYHLPFYPQPLSRLYLGPSYHLSSNVIPNEVRNLPPTVTIKRLRQPAREIARLLAKGQIVAHFACRMEFGARSLGNRSILANPSNPAVIKIINDQIKNRDFWMPFAPTILWEDRQKYLINPKDIDSPFMMLGFETTKKAEQDIPATLHPYDLTCRPQILRKADNPNYYDIINEFKKITGIGAVLNTSFNLHGDPIVCSPKDAIDTFLKSGLKYLVLENHLLTKV